MRISDWSSDVCSSDLPWRLARIDIPGAKPHPDNLVESLAMASVLPPIPQYRPLFQKRASESLSDAQLEAIIYAGDAFSRNLPSRRSEEHTSELQSLMRISYDVFCLKKTIQDLTPIDHAALHTST